ncbi:MAG: MSMEG_4193 family putative phosphomutase [Anaerolineae bacterium]|nr:MSMEG_4193 family putative phosphomutase [Anaerolineae bacterium]
MTQLYLIRHALTDWVSNGQLAGWTPGIHLNEEGHKQAESLAQRLEPIPLAAIYSSPLERALETAQAIAGPRNLTVQTRDGVGEVRYGEWTARPLKELSKSDTWLAVQVYPSGTRFPGGETLREAQARAVTEIDAICQTHPKDAVAVVSHADVIKAVVAHYLGLHLDLFQRIVISPASITIVHFGRLGPWLIRLNETGPLEPPPKEDDKDSKQEDGKEERSKAGIEESIAPGATATTPVTTGPS